MEPWSGGLAGGISSSAARETRSGIRHAPSRIEYSEWTCRWTKSAGAIEEGHSTPGLGRVSQTPLGAGTSRSDHPRTALLPLVPIPPLSVLDLAPIVDGATPGEALRNSLDL